MMMVLCLFGSQQSNNCHMNFKSKYKIAEKNSKQAFQFSVELEMGGELS